MKKFSRNVKRFFRKRKNKTRMRGKIFLIIFIFLVGVSAHSFYRFDRKILPLVLEAAELRIQTEINNVINSVVHEIILNNQISATDFILQSQTSADVRPIISVNTVLASAVCNTAAQEISARLNNLEPETVSVPLGYALGLDTLAQLGPPFKFSLAPTGNALVNYESEFTAVGINQTHFSVWLTVESVVRIIKRICRNHNTCGKPACMLVQACALLAGLANPRIVLFIAHVEKHTHRKIFLSVNNLHIPIIFFQ